jgi:acyl dehydratase
VKGGEDVCIAGDIADAYVRRGAEYLAIRATTTSNEIALGSNVSTLALSPDLGRQKSASQLVADSVSVETQSKNEPFAADPDVECLARATFDPSEIDVDGFTDHADNVHTNPSIAQGYGVSKPIVPGLMMLAYTVPVLGQVDGATSLRSGDIDLRFLAPVAVGTSLEVEISGHRDPESLRYDGKELKITIHTLDRKLVSIGSAHLDGTTRITEESDMRRK